MPKKKKNSIDKTIIPPQNVQSILDDYDKDMENSEEFSLEVDPTNQYHLSDDHKRFIKLYIEYKNVGFVANTMQLTTEEANAYFTSYSTRQEIRRINRALYHQQFKHKMMSIEDIGGYLSSIVMDELPYADRVGTMDKVQIMKMLVDLNKLKADALQHPDLIVYQDIETEVKNMSIDTIRKMLDTTKEGNTMSKEKDSLIQQLDVDSKLTVEEIDYLKTLPTKDLLQLLNNLNTK